MLLTYFYGNFKVMPIAIKAKEKKERSCVWQMGVYRNCYNIPKILSF
jgi:hypothetical protein